MRLTYAPGYIPGALQHVGSTVGLYGATPVAQGVAIANLTDDGGGAASDTIAAITDPVNIPLTADALRDDLVANTLPPLRNSISSLRAKVNSVLTWMRNVGGIAT